MGFVGTAVGNLRTYLLGLLQQSYTLQVGSAASLRSLVGFAGVTVHRSGFYAPGDGGAADYAFSAAACAVEDGGSCLAANGGGSWQIDLSTVLTALTFGAKCDGSTDDTTAIQAAMNAAALLKANLIIAPRGRTCKSKELGWKGGARLRIDGTLLGMGTNNSLLSNFSSLSGNSASPIETDVIIEGDGIIDDARTTRGSPGPTACVDYYGAVQNFTMRGVTLQNCGNFPFNFVGGSATAGAGAAHIYVSYVKVLGAGNNNSSEFAQGCDDCWVDHTRFDNVTNDFNFTFYGNNTNSGITNSFFNAHGNPGTHAVGVLSDAGQPVPSANILIQGNEMEGEDGCAVWVQGTSTSSSGISLKQKNIRIIGNDGHGNNTGHHGNWGGECILDASGVTSMGNFWHDDGGGSGTSAGIFLYPPNGTGLPAVDNFTSIGDTVYNEGAGGGVGLGAVLSAGIVKPAFYNLRVYDTQLTPTMAQAFNGTCAADCTIMGSKIDAATVAAAFNGLTINGSATIFGNGPYGNYIAGDVVVPGNSTNGGIGIFNGGLRATLYSTCSNQPSGTIYDNGDHVARVCP